jgi:hypothetical protein
MQDIKINLPNEIYRPFKVYFRIFLFYSGARAHNQTVVFGNCLTRVSIMVYILPKKPSLRENKKKKK